MAEPQESLSNSSQIAQSGVTHFKEAEPSKTKRFRLSNEASQKLLDFYVQVTTHPTGAQCQRLADMIHLTTTGNETYNALNVKKWFGKRIAYEKTKTKSANDSSLPQIANCPERTKHSRKALRASERTHLAALCAEVPCQSAKNLAGTWASIMNCDASLVREWVDEYYGTPPTGLPTPEPELQNAPPIDAHTYAESTTSPSSNAAVTPVESNSLPLFSHVSVTQGDLLCDIAKAMEVVEAGSVLPCSMSRNEFDTRMEPIMYRMNVILQRIGGENL